MTRTCGCGAPLAARKRLCDACRVRNRRASKRAWDHKSRGEPVYRVHPGGRYVTVEERFAVKIRVDEATGCWLWVGSTSRGYAIFHDGVRPRRAHRWSYEHWVGPVPAGLVLDHLCERKACVNPGHLDAVTQRENMTRYRERFLRTDNK